MFQFIFKVLTQSLSCTAPPCPIVEIVYVVLCPPTLPETKIHPPLFPMALPLSQMFSQDAASLPEDGIGAVTAQLASRIPTEKLKLFTRYPCRESKAVTCDLFPFVTAAFLSCYSHIPSLSLGCCL